MYKLGGIRYNQMMEDLVDQVVSSAAERDFRVLSADVVAEIWANPHGLHCDFKPWVSPFGVVYCLTCEATVGTLADHSDAFCECGCPKMSHAYEGGKCLQCGRECELEL